MIDDKNAARFFDPDIVVIPKRKKTVSGKKANDNARMDDDEEETDGNHGNTRLPYGLCKREGIEIQEGWTPKDAWKALEGKGISAKEEYKKLKEKGRAIGKKVVKYSVDEAKKISSDYKEKLKQLQGDRSELKRSRARLSSIEVGIEVNNDKIERAEKRYKALNDDYQKISSGKSWAELDEEEKRITDEANKEVLFINSLTGPAPEEGTKERKRWEKTILDNAEKATGYKKPVGDPEAEKKWERAMLGAMSYDIGSYVADKMKPGVLKKIDKINQIKKEKYAITDLEAQKEALDDLRGKVKEYLKEKAGMEKRAKELENSVSEGEERLKSDGDSFRDAVNSLFPTYDDCGSYGDIEDKMRANGCLPRDGNVYFDGIGVKAAVMAAGSINGFFDKFPSMRGKLGNVEARPMEHGTYAGSVADNTVYLNSDTFSDLERMKAAWQKDLEKGFHPAGTDEKAILYHEMAHQMDSYLTKFLRGDDLKKHWSERKNISSVILDEVCENLGMEKDKVKSAVSGYAKKRAQVDSYDDRCLEEYGFFNGDDVEFFAEAISEYIGSTEPRPVAVECWNVLQKYLKQAEERQ